MRKPKAGEKESINQLLGQMRAHLDAMRWHEEQAKAVKSKLERLLPPETLLPAWASTAKH